MAEQTRHGEDILQEADRVLLAHYTPASVVIDANLEILQVRGQTSPYLELAPGRATLNLLKIARESLRLGLRAALLAARKEHRSVTKEGLHVPARQVKQAFPVRPAHRGTGTGARQHTRRNGCHGGGPRRCQ